MLNRSGQVTFLVGVMLFTFIFLFAFVVNTGMLVHSKINLQNAADLAAYAGAATQARQLNTIGMLNYEMRRQYKKFLYRYYVVGNIQQGGFPKAIAGDWTDDYDFCPGESNPPAPPVCGYLTDQIPPFVVPVVCVSFDSKDIYCKLPKQKGLPKIPANPQDSISSSLAQNILSIQKLFETNCVRIGMTNRMLLLLWIYNTEPSLQELRARIKSAANSSSNADPIVLQRTLNVISGLAQGMGLVPRMMLLGKRIRSVAEFVNEPPKKINQANLRSLETADEPAAHERSILAYKTALGSLGANTFPATDVQLEELLPNAPGGQANLLELKPIQTRFITFALEYSLGPGSTTALPNCEPHLTPLAVTGDGKGIEIGFSKVPEVQTYYAVKLKAKARILFNPFGDDDLELTAYSAAKPFGSRIGPELGEPELVYGVPRNQIASCTLAAAAANPDACLASINAIPSPIAWILGTPSITTRKKGWLGAVHTEINRARLATGATSLNPELLRAGEMTAMAPNIWERGKYLIPGDFNGSEPNCNFRSRGRFIESPSGSDDFFTVNFDNDERLTRLYAPLSRNRDPAQIKNEIRAYVQSVLKKNVSEGPPTQNIVAANSPILDLTMVGGILADGLDQYVNLLVTGNGEDGEGIRTVAMRDPYCAPSELGRRPASAITLDPRFLLSDVQSVRDHWADPNVPPKNVPPNQPPLLRQGYSTKFVSFQYLFKKLKDSGQILNTNINDTEFNSDVARDIGKFSH